MAVVFCAKWVALQCLKLRINGQNAAACFVCISDALIVASACQFKSGEPQVAVRGANLNLILCRLHLLNLL